MRLIADSRERFTLTGPAQNFSPNRKPRMTAQSAFGSGKSTTWTSKDNLVAVVTDRL